jgi:hypothetical protein
MKPCAYCGRDNEDAARSCRECGTEFRGDVGATSGTPSGPAGPQNLSLPAKASQPEERPATMNLAPQKSLWSSAAKMLALLCLAVAAFHVLKLIVAVKDGRQRAELNRCRSHLMQIGLGARMWACDYNDRLPTKFESLTGHVSSPRIFVCPHDKANPMAEERDWAAFDIRRVSYELVSPGVPDGDPQVVFARCQYHGHACYGDGIVRPELRGNAQR